MSKAKRERHKRRKKDRKRRYGQRLTDFNHLGQKRDEKGHFAKNFGQPELDLGGGVSFSHPADYTPVRMFPGEAPSLNKWTPPPEQFRPGKLRLSMPIVWPYAWLPLFKTRIWGGPYRERPREVQVGVKMAEEIDLPCEIDVPTRDFDVPPVGVASSALVEAIGALAMNKVVYVGCMGGTGRTGLFMALVAKAFNLSADSHGASGAVGYVRKHYKPHAVETGQQIKYVRDFDVSTHRGFIRKIALLAAARRFLS